MKKVEVFIPAEKLDKVVDALEGVGYPGISITEIRGHGKQRGEKSQWLGQYKPHTFQPKLRLEIVIPDSDVNRIIDAICSAAKSPEFGSGKIFVSNIEDAVRIRTGQRGDIALS